MADRLNRPVEGADGGRAELTKYSTTMKKSEWAKCQCAWNGLKAEHPTSDQTDGASIMSGRGGCRLGVRLWRNGSSTFLDAAATQPICLQLIIALHSIAWKRHARNIILPANSFFVYIGVHYYYSTQDP